MRQHANSYAITQEIHTVQTSDGAGLGGGQGNAKSKGWMDVIYSDCSRRRRSGSRCVYGKGYRATWACRDRTYVEAEKERIFQVEYSRRKNSR